MAQRSPPVNMDSQAATALGRWRRAVSQLSHDEALEMRSFKVRLTMSSVSSAFLDLSLEAEQTSAYK